MNDLLLEESKNLDISENSLSAKRQERYQAIVQEAQELRHEADETISRFLLLLGNEVRQSDTEEAFDMVIEFLTDWYLAEHEVIELHYSILLARGDELDTEIEQNCQLEQEELKERYREELAQVAVWGDNLI